MYHQQRSVILLLLTVFSILGAGDSFALAQSQKCVSASLAALGVGATLTHVKVRAGFELSCKSGAFNGAPVRGDDNIVLNYENTDVKVNVTDHLRQMFTSGATVIRTILWYYHTEDVAEARKVEKDNPLGMHAATRGKLDDHVIGNLLLYVNDAKNAGFRRFYIAVAPQGRSNPKCNRAGEWGGCYEKTFDELSWSVTKQVVQALKSVESGIDVYVDIAIEDCWTPSSGQLVERNAEHFVRFMTTQYLNSFHDGKFFVSCGVAPGNIKRALDGLGALLALDRELAVRPAVIDIHNYATDPAKAQQITVAADEVARRLGVPLIIGEAYFDNANLLGIISNLEAQNSLKSLRDVIIWPGRADSKCHPNLTVQPPIDMAAVNLGLGRIDQSGKKLPQCARP